MGFGGGVGAGLLAESDEGVFDNLVGGYGFTCGIA